MTNPYFGPTEHQQAMYLRNDGIHAAMRAIMDRDRQRAQTILWESVKEQARLLGVRFPLDY